LKPDVHFEIVNTFHAKARSNGDWEMVLDEARNERTLSIFLLSPHLRCFAAFA